ncbi:MAG TPA: hypothetical protein VJM31_11775 [Vicinamibacterales bacterium]|nr:hypothetical protein [Vicinamibacterales bacterium]
MSAITRLVCLLSFVLCVASPVAAQAPPECPADEPPVVYQGTITGNASAPPFAIDLKPCQTLAIRVETSDTHPYWGSGFQVKLFNNASQTLLDEYWSSNEPMTRNLFNPNLWVPPYRGTRGDAGLPVTGVFSTYSNVAGSIDYMITVTKLRRQDYNIGGTSFQNAPIIDPNMTYRGSVHPLEPGQFFKITLFPYETFFATGHWLGHPQYGPFVKLRVYNSSFGAETTIHMSTPYGLNAYASSTFTNPNAFTADFYVRLTTQYWMLHDFSMTVNRSGVYLKGALDGGAFSSAVPLPTTAHVPLGSYVTFALVNQAGSPLAASFQQGQSTLEPGIRPGALFPANVVFSYILRSANTVVYQAVHKGQATINVSGPSGGPATHTFTIVVEDPPPTAKLGNIYNDLDWRLYFWGHAYGIPPQLMKAQIAQEQYGAWSPFEYRYEPTGQIGDLRTISRGKRYRTTREPFITYRFQTLEDSTDNALSEGPFVLPADRYLAGSPNLGAAQLRVECDANGNGGRGVNEGDVNIWVTELFRCNDDRSNWTETNGIARTTQVLGDPFTAQWSLAGSYGYLQVTYIRATELGWGGSLVNGTRNPSLLFDSDDNLADNGGSLYLGNWDLAIKYYKVNKANRSLFPENKFDNVQAFVVSFKGAWKLYNGETAYGVRVASTVPTYKLLNPGPIF